MTTKSKGLHTFALVKEAQPLPSPDVPIEKPVKGPKPEDALKNCVLELLNQGGRDQDEAEKWCRDYLTMKAQPDICDSAACDSANLREAERVFMDAKERLKPWYMDKCIAQRQRLFGENEFEAKRRCVIDYDISERVHGVQYEADQTTLAKCCESPESFHKLGVLELQLDDRTAKLMDEHHTLHGTHYYHYTCEEADRKAREELGLPQVYHRKTEPDATMPNMVGKSKEQRIKELAADTTRHPGERLISPYSGVPNLYMKSRKQVLEEVYEMDRQDRENR